jgi:hypothetical protein
MNSPIYRFRMAGLAGAAVLLSPAVQAQSADGSAQANAAGGEEVTEVVVTGYRRRCRTPPMPSGNPWDSRTRCSPRTSASFRT